MPIASEVDYNFGNQIRDFLNTSANSISGRIGAVFIVAGIMSLVISIFSSSPVLAFIGLGLTFWGVLFLLTSPKSYIEEIFLVSTAMSEYSNIDKIVKELHYVEKAYYIPFYSQDIQVPEHLQGLREPIVFISANNVFAMPSLEDISQGKFWIERKKGVLLTPPGIGLLNQIQKQLKNQMTKTDANELCDTLPRVILHNFTLAERSDNESGKRTNPPCNKRLHIQKSLHNRKQ